MYEIFNPINGVTLGWASTMFRAWKKTKMFLDAGIPADFIHEKVE